MIENRFCFRYGKHEPEVVLSAIHLHGPITREELREHLSAGKVRTWVPVLIRHGDVLDRNGVLTSAVLTQPACPVARR